MIQDNLARRKNLARRDFSSLMSALLSVLKTLDRGKKRGEAHMAKHTSNSTNAKLKSMLAFK